MRTSLSDGVCFMAKKAEGRGGGVEEGGIGRYCETVYDEEEEVAGW